MAPSTAISASTAVIDAPAEGSALISEAAELASFAGVADEVQAAMDSAIAPANKIDVIFFSCIIISSLNVVKKALLFSFT